MKVNHNHHLLLLTFLSSQPVEGTPYLLGQGCKDASCVGFSGDEEVFATQQLSLPPLIFESNLDIHKPDRKLSYKVVKDFEPLNCSNVGSWISAFLQIPAKGNRRPERWHHRDAGETYPLAARVLADEFQICRLQVRNRSL
jgi:hypothetical protein